MPPLVDGEGDGIKRRKPRSIEKEICSRLGYPYYGFLLYHSGNKRLKIFLDKYLTFLDRVIGKNFGIFILYKKHKHPLKIDEIFRGDDLDEELKKMLGKWRERSDLFTEDKSFEIAEDLGLKRSDLPCLIIYRTIDDDYDGFALLKLKDFWFPKSIEDDASVNKTMDWLTKLFDNLSESIKKKDQESAIEDFKGRMTALAGDMNILKPFFAGLKAGIIPLVKLPIQLITVLPEILEKIASKKLESAVGVSKVS